MPLPAFLLGAFAALPPVGDPPPLPPAADDIVVIARPGRREPGPDAADQWRRFCLDPMRRDGRSAAPPADDPDWAPAPEATRRRLALAAGAPAFDRYDSVRDQGLVLAEQTLERPAGLAETRCTLVILGGPDHAALATRISSLMGGPGTQRHVGESAGIPASPNWRQWAWTAMPQRGSKAWRVVAAPGAERASGTFLVVTDPAGFYASYDYVLADLKTKTDARGTVSVLTLAWTRKAEPARKRR